MAKSNEEYTTISVSSKLLTFIKTAPIRTIAIIPPLIASFLVLLWILIKDKVLIHSHPLYDSFVLSFASIVFGFVGVIYIYRREMPELVSSATVKGEFAIFTGIMLILFFWGLGIAGLVFAFYEN